MTARERAAQLWCLPQHSHKPMDVEFAESIASALADERRRVWEEAAKECDQRLFNCQRVLDTRGYRMFQPGELAVWRANADLLRRLAEWIRAKAHAGQEG